MVKNKPIKWLSFKLTPKEYSDFWYMGELLNLAKKNNILKEMMRIVKELKENE